MVSNSQYGNGRVSAPNPNSKESSKASVSQAQGKLGGDRTRVVQEKNLRDIGLSSLAKATAATVVTQIHSLEDDFTSPFGVEQLGSIQNFA